MDFRRSLPFHERLLHMLIWLLLTLLMFPLCWFHCESRQVVEFQLLQRRTQTSLNILTSVKWLTLLTAMGSLQRLTLLPIPIHQLPGSLPIRSSGVCCR